MKLPKHEVNLFRIPKYSEIFNEQPDIDFLVSTIQRWNKENAVRTLSYLAFAVAPLGRLRVNLGPGIPLLQALQHVEAQRYRRNQYAQLITRRQVAQLIKLVLMFANGEEPGDNVRDIVKCCLTIYELTDPWSSARGDLWKRLSLAPNIEQSTGFDFRYAAWRAYRLYLMPALSKGARPEYIRILERTLDIPLHEFISLFFRTDLAFTQAEFTPVFPNMLTSGPISDKVVERFLALTCVHISEFADNVPFSNDVINNLNDLSCFQTKPLIRMSNGQICCPWFIGLRDEVVDNLYWLARHLIPSPEETEFTKLLGMAFEDYILTLWQEREGLVVEGEKNVIHSPDVFITMPQEGTLIAIECKTSRYAANQYQRGRHHEAKFVTQDTVISAAKQLAGGLQQFRNEKYQVNSRRWSDFRVIYPVVCTLTDLHCGHKYWGETNAAINNQNVFAAFTPTSTPVVKPVRLISAMEMEILRYIPHVPWRILAEWLRVEPNYSFRSFLVDRRGKFSYERNLVLNRRNIFFQEVSKILGLHIQA